MTGSSTFADDDIIISRTDWRSIGPEHELAVAFEERSGPHIELSVVADEKQRALRHLFRALQKLAGIVGSHLVGKRLAVLVVAIAHIRRQNPGRRRRGFRKCGCRQDRK